MVHKTFTAKAILFDVEGTLLTKDYSQPHIPDIEIQGSANFLHKVQGLKWGVVTTLDNDRTLKRMKNCQLIIPDVLITSDNVKSLKPSPVPYQTAISKLGLQPQDCIVFEDSSMGIDSAVGAGCRVIQVGRYEEDHRPLAIIDHWDQINILQISPESITFSITSD